MRLMRRCVVAQGAIKQILVATFTFSLLQTWLIGSTVADGKQVAPDPNGPEQSFEHLWKTFDERYALFDAKGIDWDALYRVYRPKVTPATTDDQLFSIMCDLLRHLNDNHVVLISKNPNRSFSTGYLGYYFSEAGGSPFGGKSPGDVMRKGPVPKTYSIREFRETGDGIFAYGWAADHIGYLHFNRVANMDASRSAIDEIMAAFRNAKAVIIDIRRNGGGDDRIGKLIADRFADKRRLYMTTEDRTGPEHDDFAEPKEWYVKPDGPRQFTKRTLLLTDRTSISAAENFALAMKTLPHVVQIGDFTSGCFADPDHYKLPNGWGVTVSRNVFRDHHGFCWEGIGVPPEIWQPTTRADVEQERDPVFELALAIIDSGGIEPKRITRAPAQRKDEE